VIPASSETPVGPPPSIPPALPPPPSGGVSIKGVKTKEEEKKKGFELSDLAPENVYKNMKSATGYGPDEKVARAAMQEGEALFRDKKYKEAAAKFATAADRWPDSPLEEDALFLKAESEFFSDQYPKAHDTYGGLLKKYANTRHLDAVSAREFALGRYWEQIYDAHPSWPVTPNVTDNSRPLFDTFGYAIQAFERIRQHDPTGPLADASLMALGNAYFRRGRYEEAAYNYDLLRKEYPNSKHQMKAHLLGLHAKMRIYQGTAYDETPLRDAGKIADQTLKQFGDKLGDERPRIEQARLQVIEEKANRDFTRAQYYDQRACYGAARLYYNSVIDEYPSTQRAKEARTRLDQIRTEPDEPPNRFAWLTGLFESKKK
jgi:TolA-binding protein